MNTYTSKTFWSGAAERAIKTFAQALLAMVATGTVIWGVDWAQALGVAATAALLAILTALADPARTDTAVTTASAPAGLSPVGVDIASVIDTAQARVDFEARAVGDADSEIVEAQ